MGKGKRFSQSQALFDRDKLYKPGEALSLIKQMARAKFDESIELSFLLGVDARKADQAIRGTVSLPKGTGKTARVVVFAQGDKAREAKEAGADEVGAQELADKIQGGWTDFDVAVAAPDMMPIVGKLGKTLGPRGLMPNPKSGTVTPDVGKAVTEVKAGKVEYRNDKFGNVHAVIGKASFPTPDLVENYLAIVEEILRSKPASSKGRYVKSMAVSSTMGPGVRIDPNDARDVTLPAEAEAAAGAAS